jgi:hypothetical protein
MDETKRSVVGGWTNRALGLSRNQAFVWCIRVFFILSRWNPFLKWGMDRSRRGAVECMTSERIWAWALLGRSFAEVSEGLDLGIWE